MASNHKTSSIHHSFDTEIATEYGIQEAIIIHHFQHWITINKRLDRNFHEGSYWSYQSLDEISAHFPYWSKDEIFNIIEKLCTGRGRRSKKPELLHEPVLKKGNFNQSKYDRTVWYSFLDEPKWILAQAKMKNGASQSQDRLQPTPIPDTKPDTKPIKEYKEKPPSKKRQPVTAHITFNSEERRFEGITEEDLKDWRSTYTAVNIDKELNECKQWAMSVSRQDYRKSINKWFRNVQEKNSTSSQAMRSNTPYLQVPALPSDFEANSKMAIDLVKISDDERVHSVYKLEISSGALRFNKPGKEGAVDIDFNMEHKLFKRSCRMHISKISEIHPKFKVYFESEDNVD